MMCVCLLHVQTCTVLQVFFDTLKRLCVKYSMVKNSDTQLCVIVQCIV